LGQDRLQRVLGVPQAAAAQWRAAPQELVRVTQAYAAGINAYVDEHLQGRPPEFLALGLAPGHWAAEDSLVWAITVAWELSGNGQTEMTRMELANSLSLPQIQAMLPAPQPAPAGSLDFVSLYRHLFNGGAPPAARGMAAMPFAAPPRQGIGSNAWVVSGAHSVTGAPLLANDPHMQLTAPSLWYLARLEMPGRYRGLDQWKPFTEREEVIRIRGQDDLRLRVLGTRHGPVVSGEPPTAANPAPPAGTPGQPHRGHVLALRWTALAPDAGTLVALLQFNRARSVAELTAASRHLVAPSLNFVMADAAGQTGLVLAGRIPQRRPDDDLHGLAPAPGWDPRYDWLDPVPPEQMPRLINPPAGWPANANQPTLAPDPARPLLNDWPAPYRQQRIEQLLAATARHSVESLRTIQADVLSLPALALLPLLRAAQSSHPLAPQALALLARFDGRMEAGQAAPLIYHAWLRELLMSPRDARYGEAAALLQALVQDVAARGAGWCSKPPADCRGFVDAALQAALAQLQRDHGADVSTWRWDQAHRAVSVHAFSGVPVLRHGFELAAAVPGEGDTVNAIQAQPQPDGSFLGFAGPSLRAVYDLADPARSRIVLTTGQSGLPWSRWYRDQGTQWLQVNDLALWPAESDPVSVLTLSPGTRP
jgi:penicillin G amidase